MSEAPSPPDRDGAGPPRAVDRGFVTTLVAATAVLLFLYMVRDVLFPFVAAGVIAFVLTPAVDWLAHRTRSPRIVGAIGVFVGLVLLAALFIAFAGPVIGRAVVHTLSNLPVIITRLAARLLAGRSLDLLGQPMNAQQVSAAAMQGLGQLARSSRLASLMALTAGAVFAFLLSWVLLFYFLVDGPRIRRGLTWLVPPAHRPLARQIWRHLSVALRRYFVGVGVVMIYAAVAAYIGLGLFLGLRHAVLLAALTGLLEMIPVAGPLSSAVIAGLAAVEHATGAAGILAYVAYAVALRLSIDQLIGPVVLGQAARLHPTLVIFCFLSGGLLFGVTGVILAVPVALSVKAALSQLYRRQSTRLAEAAPAGAPRRRPPHILP
ncbi:MAG: AI-2E family transporter [Caulobacteraceae bacterium]